MPDIETKTVKIDLSLNPYGECVFFEEHLDNDACGNGTGNCRIAFLVKQGHYILCPKMGPRGGNKQIPPDECPLKRFRVVIEGAEETDTGDVV